MKTKEQLLLGIAELEKQTKNPALPESMKQKLRDSIQLLKWVLE